MFYVVSFVKWSRRILVTVWFWLGAAIGTLLMGASCKIFGANDHDSITFYIEHVMATFIELWMTPFWSIKFMKLKTVSLEEITDDKGPFVLAANHNSIIDTLFMSMLKFRKTYTYNVKWSWVPIFGPLCGQAGYIGIDTKNAVSRGRVVDNVISKMEQGYSVMYYPQGTRSKTPNVDIVSEDLKHGAFSIAMKGKYKILPIAIKNSHKILRPWGIADIGEVEIIIGKSFTVDNIEDGKTNFCNAVNGALRI